MKLLRMTARKEIDLFKKVIRYFNKVQNVLLSLCYLVLICRLRRNRVTLVSEGET
jgi:hypothetical protein